MSAVWPQTSRPGPALILRLICGPKRQWTGRGIHNSHSSFGLNTGTNESGLGGPYVVHGQRNKKHIQSTILVKKKKKKRTP
jgi:hypothetical protein